MGNLFECQFYEIIIMSVQLAGYSPERFNTKFLTYLSFPNILDNYVCFVVSYLSVFLRCRVFNESVGKIVIRKPRESYGVINFIFMGCNFDNIPSNAAIVVGSIKLCYTDLSQYA